jgi:hypothetical protein
MRYWVMVLLLVLVGTPVQARLGDNQDQLTARYGPATNAGQATVADPVAVETFHQEGWMITVRLINGISVGETFQKPGGPTEQDIAALLALNSQEHVWAPKQLDRTLMQTLVPSLAPVSKAWQRDDGAYAFLPSPLPFCLTIQSKQLVDVDAAKEAADKKAKETSLQGF